MEKAKERGEAGREAYFGYIVAHEVGVPAAADPHPTLPRAPLIEAFVELRWPLRAVAGGLTVDPGYAIAAGRFYELVRGRFPFVEQLPAAAIPDQLTPYVVKQRFRVAEGRWPVVQIGPGVATLNLTEPYSWTQFRDLVIWIGPRLRQAYEGFGDFQLNGILMRYIDAIDLAIQENDVLEFLAAQMHTVVQLPAAIATYPHRDGNPRSFSLAVGLPLNQPPSTATLQFATGERSGRSALIWDLTVASTGDQAQGVLDNLDAWLEAGHAVNTSWFQSLVAGGLHAQFQQEAEE